jgi:hypothetical protein
MMVFRSCSRSVVVVVVVMIGITMASTSNAFVTQQQSIAMPKRQTALGMMVDPHSVSNIVMMTTPTTIDSLLSPSGLQDQLNSLAVAAASSTADDSGWWSAYLNIFKTALLAVHTTIDQPLRSAGITQTWGPSIALFTAGKS